MNIEFNGKTVIVTGAAHGFGRAMSLAFAERGAHVWACDVVANELAETCRASGGACEGRVVDVSDKAAVHAFVASAAATTGRVDILVNNAGGVLGQVGKPLEEVTAQEWQSIFDVNVTGAFYFSQAVAPSMKAARSGRIINISSGAGLGVSLTGIQAYASAKAAQIALTRQLAHELGPWGITVNNIAPGFVRSNASTERQWQSYGEQGQRAIIDRIALKTLGTPDDIAFGALFFASDFAKWITGQVLSIDGGKVMDQELNKVLEYLKANHTRALAELVEFAAIPSVSADPAHETDVRAASAWVESQVKAAGPFAVRTIPTPRNPVVYAEWLGAPGKPTVLVYGHYDVQPPDPLDKWTTPPFVPTIRDGRLYARGVSDDKGPMLVPIKVAQAFFATTGRLPVNIKCMFEGEEEIGSPSLEAFIQQHKELLAADFVLSADGAMWRASEPSLTVASRGLAGLEFTLTGPGKDLHSGRHGGSVANPLHAMATLVASLHAPDGRVAVPGFYDAVRDITPSERADIAALPFDEAAYLAQVGAPASVGEAGYSTLERQWTRPTLEINGMWGGYEGPGSKTVIPSEAHAKITCRLVPDQDPHAIAELVIRHLKSNVPAGTRLSVHPGDHGARPYRIPANHFALRSADAALQAVYGVRPLKVSMGGTVPISELFARHMGLETVFFSFSTADEDYHAPNEFFRVHRLHEGLEAWSRYWQLLGQPGSTA